MLPRTNSGGGMVGNVLPGCTGSVLGKDIKGAGLITPPSLIEWNGLRFLVMDAPRPSNVHLYLKRFLEYNVSDLVCVCERTYDPKVVMAAGIKVHEMKYDDGSAPPEEIISRWLEVVNIAFGESAKDCDGDHDSLVNGEKCIAVHCVAGLGRAPVLVAIAFIEHGMDPIDAVEYLRKRRRGAINAKQLAYLISYTPIRTKSSSCCSIS